MVVERKSRHNQGRNRALKEKFLDKNLKGSRSGSLSSLDVEASVLD